VIFNNKNIKPSIILLGSLAASGPMALSIHVQSIPAISADFDTTYAVAQLTVSIFLIVFATSQLFIGPLSDKIGRRPVIFGGLVLLGLASLGATFAPSIEILILARVLQALGGCATLVVPRAIVQDIYEGNEAARMMALVAMIQSIAPLTAPIIGGVLDAIFGWRSIFAFLALFICLLGLWALVALKETRPLENDGNTARWSDIFARYGRLLSSRIYVGYTLAFAAGTSGFFGFLAVGPNLIIENMGLAPILFSIFLMLITLQFPAGNYVASKMTLFMSIDRTLLWGTLIGIGASIIFLMLSPLTSLWTILLPMMLYAFSNGILFPNAMAGAASVDRRIAGTAASFTGFCQLGTGAIVALLISALPTNTVKPYAMTLLILSIAALAGVLIVFYSKKKNS
jgi:DHA1 family bicyclomycin/chloramphenicol resistance-like MFS transporter